MSKATVLIVEDEAIIAADLANRLRGLDYEVLGISASGEEAVALAKTQRPDLVLMDIRLGGPMDGVEAAEAIRRQCDLPVVYLTAHSDRATLQRAKLTEPFGYILKPFEERELETHIEMALYKHRADRTLREQREWLHITLTSIGDAVIATDPAGRVTFLNPAAEALTGWKQEEALGQPIQSVFRIINELTREAAEDIAARVLQEGRAVTLANHTTLVARDGREIPIEDSAAPIRDGGGTVSGVVLVFHDVTEKRWAQDELARERANLQAVFDVVNVGLVLIKGDGTVQRVNNVVSSWFGENLSAHRGGQLGDLVGCIHAIADPAGCGRTPYCASCPIRNTFESTLRSGEPLHAVETEATVVIDGTPVRLWLDVSADPLVLDGEQRVILALRNITARKKAEEALRDLNAELEERVTARTAELARAVATLERQAHQLRTLTGEVTLAEQRERRRLADVLHDELQQLLVATRLRAHMLGRTPDPAVRQGTQEIVGLIEEALTATRTLTGELSPPTLQRGGLLPALEWLARWMEQKHRLSVEIATPSAPLPPLPEESTVLLYQAVRECLLNTVKYAQVKEATVTVVTDGPTLTVTVADAGVGFDPARLQVAGGTEGGVGLLGIHERLEWIGGRLTIASAPGQGTHLTLVAPLGPVPEAEPMPTSPTDAGLASPAARSRRILVVDDHALVRRGLVTMLRKEPDLLVVGEATNGQEAVERNRALIPDVILMDIGMPVLNGIDATRAIHAEYPAVRVIGLSMFEESEQSEAMRAAGAVAYVSKSDAAEALLAAIRGAGEAAK